MTLDANLYQASDQVGHTCLTWQLLFLIRVAMLGFLGTVAVEVVKGGALLGGGH